MAAENPAMKLDPKYDHFDYPTSAPVAKPGHPGHTTEAQQAQVEQLRLMLEAEGHTKRLDTLTLLRFLRARKFDVAAAKKMYVLSLLPAFSQLSSNRSHRVAGRCLFVSPTN